MLPLHTSSSQIPEGILMMYLEWLMIWLSNLLFCVFKQAEICCNVVIVLLQLFKVNCCYRLFVVCLVALIIYCSSVHFCVITVAWQWQLSHSYLILSYLILILTDVWSCMCVVEPSLEIKCLIKCCENPKTTANVGNKDSPPGYVSDWENQQ